MSITEVATEYCPGSFAKVTRRGSKYIRGQLKYKCPECGGHYSKDALGKLYKHGYRLGMVTQSDTSLCSICKKSFSGLDYICPTCRKKS